MKLFFIFIFFCSSSLFANADVKSNVSKTVVDAKKIESLVIDYYLSQYQKQKNSFIENLSHNERKPDCGPNHPPQPPSSRQCIDTVCNKLGSFGCDQPSEINDVTLACRGVDASCVESVCAKVGPFDCDQMSEIQTVTNMCRSLFDTRCMDVVCDYLGDFGCDQMSEVNQVSVMCKGRIDSGCIQDVCTRLGSFGCDQMSELQQVVKSCGGH